MLVLVHIAGFEDILTDENTRFIVDSSMFNGAFDKEFVLALLINAKIGEIQTLRQGTLGVVRFR